MGKKWMGEAPDRCQICSVPLTTTFVDGRTAFGQWAIMCPACHRDQRVGLGTGKGQKFDVKTLEKVEG